MKKHAISAPVQKNQCVPLTITGMTAEGNGVGKCDGFAVFVPQTAVGDSITAKIVKVEQHFAYGIIEELITPSADRIEPDCPVFASCGGCVFRHVSYDAEQRYKTSLVTDAFARIGGISPKELLPIFGAETIDACRNKAQYPCGTAEDGSLQFGFYAARSHRLVPYGDCRLQPPIFSQILEKCKTLLQDITPYDEKTAKGVLRHVYLRQGFHSGEIMVCFIAAKKILNALRPVGEELMREFPSIRSVMLNINSKPTNVILGNKTVCVCGKDTIADIFCGIPVSLSAESFYQVNTAQAERLFAEAKRLANPQKNELLLDLYCGTGVIGLSMADCAGSIIGVEIVEPAVTDAIANAKRAGISNARFFAGDAGKIAADFAANKQKPDIIVLDPPRKGCDTLTLDACIQMAPKRIVMVSCNPATAARDVKYLSEHGFSFDVLRPVDLFPRTGHVECVVLMSRNEN